MVVYILRMYAVEINNLNELSCIICNINILNDNDKNVIYIYISIVFLILSDVTITLDD